MTAGALKHQNFVSEDFLVISGDAFTNIDLSKAIRYHLPKTVSTLIAQPHPHPQGLGVLEIDYNNKIIDFMEKPENIKPSLINTGIYIINKRLLNLIPDGFYDFGKQLLPSLVGKIYAYVTYEFWSDIGTLSSYYYTNYLISRDFNEEMEKQKNSLSVFIFIGVDHIVLGAFFILLSSCEQGHGDTRCRNEDKDQKHYQN